MKLHKIFLVASIYCVALAACAATAAEVDLPNAVKPAAMPFSLAEVRLLDGPFKAAQDLDGAYLLSLDPERLLHVFRLNAGLPSTAKPLGGWEAPGVEVRGHFVGHYLSACAMMYQCTGDERFKQRVDHLVAQLALCQEALGDGYLSAFPASHIDRVEAGQPVWAPYYVIHKIMAGLLDAQLRCNNRQAGEMLGRMIDYFYRRTERLDDARMNVVLGNEFGGMMEVLADYYGATGSKSALELARRFDHHLIFDPLAAHKDKLSGHHANTQIPKIIGAARVYELTGDKRYQTIANYFWDQVTGHRSFVNGGHSVNEVFMPMGNEAADLIPTTAETCNTYNMLKLTWHLFEEQPEARFADYYERALYNHILASIDPDSGMTTYYFSLKPGHFKVYGSPEESFWCCTGTGVENPARYNEAIYAHDDTGLWVNLFIPSELTWKEKGITLRQETTFPEQQGTALSIKAERPTQLALRLRVPQWATTGVTLKVNGKAQDTSAAKPGSYFTVDRQWADGDRVELSLPMSLYLHRATDLPNSVAILYGPLVLAGRLGREGYPSKDILLLDQNQHNHLATPAVPALVSDSTDPASWLKPVADRPLEFTTVGTAKPHDVTLAPLYRVHHERYTVYWKLYTPEEYAKHEQQLAEAEARARADLARVVDDAGFGLEQPERDHKFVGEKSNRGPHLDKFYRDAAPGGWFSCQMKVLPDVPLTLRCTYWGSDFDRDFDIFIDDEKIGSESLKNTHPDKFFTVDYAIPPQLTTGKQTVTVKFAGKPNQITGGVFGCVVLKPEAEARSGSK